ncbi:MAG: hypothetical protein JWN95_173 [Frankiales bacterium]|nr:hypothetical protein [Frankiales bacterium]
MTTRLLCVDAAADARKVSAVKVDTAADAQAIKAFVDQVYANWSPAYLVLLGGPELLAQVPLDNPLWTGNADDDPDQFIASDLPYACEAPYTTAANTFRGPTRVVGRLPDAMGASSPVILRGLLANAAAAASVTRPASVAVLAVTAKVWQASTKLSVGKLAAATSTVHTSPADGPNWSKPDLSAPLHFINCHGGEFDPKFYGQASATQAALPTAMDAALLTKKISVGTVVSAECCYGAAHWPASAAGGQAGIAMTYLSNGAAGFFGSSTVAYGPAAANDYADVLARLFLDEVLAGASLGRAALSARQRFVQGQSFLDPTDIKTLAQFDLLGDPSIQPFTVSAAAPKNMVSAGVRSRRAVASAVGMALQSAAVASSGAPRGRAGLTRTRLAALLGREVPVDTVIRTFDSAPVVAAAEGAESANAAATPPSRGAAAVGRGALRRLSAAPLTPAGLAAPVPAVSAVSAVSAVAHVAFVPGPRGHPKSLLVVREEPGSATEIRRVVRR